MPKRIIITLAIIAGIGVGTGALVQGILLMTVDYQGQNSVVAAAGSAILAASIAALVAQLAGAFRELDDPDR